MTPAEARLANLHEETEAVAAPIQKALDKDVVRYHTVGDSRSSPYTPMLGNTILVRMGAPKESGDIAPGIITRVYGTSDDRVDCTVFTPQGSYHLRAISYNEDPTVNVMNGMAKVWFWPKVPERRPIKQPEISGPRQQELPFVGPLISQPIGQGPTSTSSGDPAPVGAALQS